MIIIIIDIIIIIIKHKSKKNDTSDDHLTIEAWRTIGSVGTTRAAAEGSLLSIQSAASRAAVMISFFIWACPRLQG